jgi:hypothetical protein
MRVSLEKGDRAYSILARFIRSVKVDGVVIENVLTADDVANEVRMVKKMPNGQVEFKNGKFTISVLRGAVEIDLGPRLVYERATLRLAGRYES